MRETHISLPELALIAGTRAALGAGLGLLLAGRMSDEQRRAVGWTLFMVGAVSTIPLALEVLGGGRTQVKSGEPSRQTIGVAFDYEDDWQDPESRLSQMRETVLG
jgi:hypothetical protein